MDPLEEPSTLKKSLVIVLLVVLFAAIPVGVYLSTQTQIFLPRAANFEPTPKVGFKMEQRGDMVDIYVKSDLDIVNLASVTLGISNLSVRVATESSAFNKWVEAKVGEREIRLTAGKVGGIKTDIGGRGVLLASLEYSGQGEVEFKETKLFRSSDNLNLLSQTEPQKIAVRADKTFLPEPQAREFLISPKGGEVFGYNSPVAISWAVPGELVSINLLLNGNFFGSILHSAKNTGGINWMPSQTIPVAFLTDENTFGVEVSGDKKVVSGPFGISLEPKYATPSTAVLSVGEFSKMISLFNTRQPGSALDLNSDGVINQIDFWVAVRNLL